VVKLTNVSRWYGNVVAVDNISTLWIWPR